ncbi:hypothetical protein F4821DRAFT_131710 [Hypoxylon rubiginosum]|uniref:Uncharacterized protein n=1 Tax=Hypoxylon rubiginosum TaxID=110542 RepID=A0ACC0D1R3_9PEZI|nr:hypothetical protein F4821DRAFT_131710 [Hypoxylon rubiginosum]
MDASQISTRNPSHDGTFTKFGILPKEIRDAIWDFATRDEQLGVHFFSVSRDADRCYYDNIDKEHLINPTYQYTIYSLRYQRVWGYRVSSLRYFSSTIAGSSHDPSMYLTDSGLWTACTESRDAMERRYRNTKIPLPYYPSEPFQPGIAIGNPTSRTGITGSFTSFGSKYEGERQYFTVLTGDLVCFRLRDLADLHAFDSNFRFLAFGKGAYIENIALEFDPTWESPVHNDFKDLYEDEGFRDSPRSDAEKRVHALINAMDNMRNLWFIDYRIRRSRDPSRRRGIRDDRAVFYGNGCRFVEVRPKDSEWEFEDGIPLSPRGRNVFGFIDRFEHAADFYKNYEEYDGYDSEDPGKDYDDDAYPVPEDYNFWESDESWFRHHDPMRGARFGALACEPYE